jgi:predicted phosphodiesterase
MFTIICYSDLHLGVGDDSDDMLLNEESLISHLERGVCSSDVLILNGDIFETIQGDRWAHYAERFMEIWKKRPDIVNFIRDNIVSGNIEYICGNHDAVVRSKQLLPGAKRRVVISAEGVKIVFEHGNVPDLFCKFGVIGEAITWLAGWIERLFWKDIDIKIARLVGSISRLTQEDRDPYEKYALKVVRQENAQVVVFGHTHKTYRKEVGNLIYIDCGKMCNSKNTVDQVVITINNGTYEIKQTKVTV